MKISIAAIVFAVCLSACSSIDSRTDVANKANRLTDDEKHRLYSAALAASESPLETELFKEVCREIGIFDADGKPNNKYMSFVASHVDWGTNPQSNQFRREIDSKEKAEAYVRAHLPQ
jgi:hypothetical protein